MSIVEDNRRFIELIGEHLDELQDLLGAGWPVFCDYLLEFNDRLWMAAALRQQLEVIDDLLEYCQHGPAQDLIWSLLRQALAGPASPLESARVGKEVRQPVRRGVRRARRRRYESTRIGKDTGRPEEAGAGDLEPIRAASSALARQVAAQRAGALGASSFSTPVPAQRYLNTGIASADGETFVPRDQPLVYAAAYALLVWVGPQHADALAADVAFPDKALNLLWHDAALPLLVGVTSHDFSVEPRTQQISLPRDGESDQARFSLRPMISSGHGTIRVELFYRGYLLQSLQIDVLVGPSATAPPESLRPCQSAYATFTTTEQLYPDDLRLVPERVLTIDIEKAPRDGSIDVRFLDRTAGDDLLACYDTHRQPEALGNAIRAVRQALALMVTGETRNGQQIEGYKWKVVGDDELLNQWLPRLADVGRSLYRVLLPADQDDPDRADQGARLRAALLPGVVIQINSVLGAVTLPWALLYERPVKYLPGRTRVCEQYMAAPHDCAECPHAADPYIVCPHAFWGFRYVIEQLPCWSSDKLPHPIPIVRRIANRSPLQMNVNVWSGFSLWRDHLEKLSAGVRVDLLVAEQIPQLEAIWEQHGPQLDVIYFYTHGGIDDQLGYAYLKLSDGQINSNFLEAAGLTLPRAPLVFLNGCSTGSYGPESYLSLIDDFRKAGAAGVIGTECAMPEIFAEAYAAALFPQLFRQAPLGRAMLDARLSFLRDQKNPLCLAYTLYAASEIVLAQPIGAI